VSRVRTFAIITLVLLGGYHVMRVIVAQCSGAACDAYIPLSLLLPLLVLASAVVTALLAIAHARADGTWLIILVATAAVGVLGPVVSLIVLRDNPDAFVILSTVLVLLIPVSALVYSFFNPATVTSA
jgi:uncharacterized membrane protein HdeD (DUF308 family)